MMLYFLFLMAFAGNEPTVGSPRWMVLERSSLGPQHLRHKEHQQLEIYLISTSNRIILIINYPYWKVMNYDIAKNGHSFQMRH